MLDHTLADEPRRSLARGVGFAALAATVAGAGYVLAPRKAPAALTAGDRFTDGDLITVVVGTVGRPSLLDTVQAVLAQSYPAVEIVVVDNAPTSGRVDEALKSIDDARCIVVREPRRGVSKARNTGVRHASGQVVAFTDDDAEPDSEWLAELAAVYSADADAIVAGVTGRVVGIAVETDQQRWFEESGLFEKGARRTVWTMAPEGAVPDALGERGTAALFPYTAGEMGSGNNMSFRKSAFVSLAGFDERIGPGTPTKGGEDLELFRRAVLRGGTIVYAPTAVVGHHHRADHEALREQMFGYGSGMAAIVTKLFLDGGAPARALLGRLPTAFRMLLAPEENRFAEGAPPMPRDLKITELLGYLCGPFLYVKSITVRGDGVNS
ncbi:glycosyltransferase family 2 protein [Rhodococcus sp. 077-4]|uniref:glycosyltransferase family 2 protein n=1 Tax=Rhodococcus sp. 077-4 TaxID=2789271 RepID=UPI0039F5FC31